MKRISIPYAYIVSCILYTFWAMGDPNITIWHWILPALFRVISIGVWNIIEEKRG